MKKTTPLPRAEQLEARKASITDVAIQCFADKGFHKTSMRDIAREAGVSLGNLYNHFENKEAMIRHIAETEADSIDEFARAIAEQGNDLATLDWFIVTYLEQSSGPEAAVLTAEVVAEGLRNSTLGASFISNRQDLVQQVASLIAAIRHQHTVTGAISDTDCAEYILDLIEGIVVRHAFERRVPDSDDAATLSKAARHLIGL